MWICFKTFENCIYFACAHAQAHVPQHASGGARQSCRRWLSFNARVLGTALRSSGLGANILSLRATSVAPVASLLLFFKKNTFFDTIIIRRLPSLSSLQTLHGLLHSPSNPWPLPYMNCYYMCVHIPKYNILSPYVTCMHALRLTIWH